MNIPSILQLVCHRHILGEDLLNELKMEQLHYTHDNESLERHHSFRASMASFLYTGCIDNRTNIAFLIVAKNENQCLTSF